MFLLNTGRACKLKPCNKFCVFVFILYKCYIILTQVGAPAIQPSTRAIVAAFGCRNQKVWVNVGGK